MPDLRQALKDFVATSNSGKYKDEAELISKFPELKGYNIQVLKDFVATSNSGKYKTEDELFSKFPEFNVGAAPAVTGEVKKKVPSTTALPSAGTSLASQSQVNVPEEQDYFTGTFGNILRGFDNIVPLGIGDFIDDMARGVAAGYAQGDVAQAADRLLLSGTKATPEQIQKFIDKQKTAQKIGSSKEMQDYQKIYESEGKGFWGVVKGLASNPSVIPEVITSSLTSMATNTDALTAGAAGIGTGAGYGAAAGATAGGIGAVPGAIGGAISAVPYAFGLASSVVEMGSTFGELLNEELNGKEMTKENVKAILENPDKLNSIRNKAIARGIVIGTVDAFTGKLASGVGAKTLTKSAAKSSTGAATRGAVTRATATGAAIEAAGGSAGEAAARAVTGQDMDTSEILLEGIAELPGGIRSTIQARMAKPTYKVNGQKVTAEDVDNLINTMSHKELAATKIDIENDYEGRSVKIQDKIVTGAIKDQVRQANPELNEPSLNAITEIEKELKKLEGNTTQTGKDKAAALRAQIKNIQENQLQEEAVVETAKAEAESTTALTPEQRAEKINQLEKLLSPETTLPSTFDRPTLERELETLKKEQDAIQEQATNQGVLRTEQSELGLPEVVEGNQERQIATAGLEENLIEEEPQEVVSSKTQVNVAPFFNTRVDSVQEAEELRKSPAYQQYKQSLKELADIIGLKGVAIDEVIGGYKNEAGEDFIEISNKVTFDEATLDQAEEYAALAAALSPEVQEASIASRYVEEGAPEHNANEYEVKVSDVDTAVKSLKEAGISNFSVDETNGVVYFIDVLDFADPELQNKIGKFVELLDQKGISYEQSEYQPVESRYVDKGKRKEILRRVKSKGAEVGQRGQGFSSAIERAIQRDAEFQGIAIEEYGGVPVAAAEVEVAVEPEEKFTPISKSDVKTEAFTRDNAIDYEEDEKEGDNGRTYTYMSSITLEATDADGNTIGAITKMVDEDGTLSFTAEDVDGNPVGKGAIYDTLGEAKQALADRHNKILKKEFDKEARRKSKEAEKAKVKAEKAKAKTEKKKAKPSAKKETAPEPVVEEDLIEDIEGTIEQLLELDPNDRGSLGKISDALGQAIKDIEKFEKTTLGVNIALPVMKAIIKSIKALVDAGISLREAIKQVAKENNVSSRDIVNGINTVTQIAPIQEDFDALMTKADALITRQKSKNIADDKIVSNLELLVRNSEVYQNANDAQKKIMEREVRAKMGIAPKRAVSIGRVLGALKDITNISRSEKMNVIKRIRELSRDAAKDLVKEIREMATKGKISTAQATNIIAKFSKVNLLNEVSVSSFVDYMARVFADAEYDNKINVAKGKLKAAKKNIATKIGIADGLALPLQRLFSMNPTLIPDEYLERYLELVDMFSARQAVLTLEEKSVVKRDTEAILAAVDEEQSQADELADRFNSSENKVYDDGKLNYAESVKKMLSEKEITDKEADTMRKYKEDIIPQVEEVQLDEDEINEEKELLISLLKQVRVDEDTLPTADERRLAERLSKLIKTDAVQGLNNTELKNLLKLVDNINNGYLPHYTQLMVEKMNAINNGKVLASSVRKAKLLPFSSLYSRLKATLVRSGKSGIAEMIRRNPLYNIDQLFGDFKTKNIFNSLLEKAAEGEAMYNAEVRKVQNILENAEEKVAKSFKLDPNKTLMSKFKMMTYMIQLEYESNKDSKQVNPAADYLKATIKHIDEGKSRFGERDANMLQDILDTYSKDGQIDIDKLYNSFNQAEKDALADIKKLNESLREKAEYTAAIIRGDRISPLNNYVHLNVLHEHQPNDLTTGSAFADEYNNSMRPSTKAKSLIARTGKVSPLNFDVFASAQRGAKFVLLDYNLTEPIRTARKTINQATADLESEGRLPKQQREILNAINSALEESVENLLTNSFVQNSLLDEAIDFVSKQGYRAVLAGTGRFISELTSNIAFAFIADPKAFNTGTKYRGVIMSTDAPLIMENVGSKQTNRIFPTDTLSGKFIDTSILSQASGIQGGKSKNYVANKIQQIWNLSGKKYKNFVELTADTLISTPDKIVMRPMWFGSFANEFKNITGKEVDFDKIAKNDEAYMKDNKEAIETAKKIADERSVMTGATDNAFMGILKGTVKPNQSATAKAFNNFNNYMTRFLIFEYVTARTAIMAAIGNGSLTKKQGAAMLGAVSTRMIVYGLLSQMLGSGLMELFFDDDEEEETEKSYTQKLGQAMAGAFSSLLLGRDFGNATKMVINYGIEEANEKYLDFLREGEYDPYKDGIVYSLIPRDDRKNDDLGKLLMNMGGSYTPALNTASLIYKNRKAILSGEPTKKKEDAIEREQRTINERIPLEILGNAGLIPLYKDVKKAVVTDINKGLNKAVKEQPSSEEQQRVREKITDLRSLKGVTTDEDELRVINRKIRELSGSEEQQKATEEANKRKTAKKRRLLYDSETGEKYDNESEMKRYNPSLYKQRFGPGSDWYEENKAEKAVNKKLNKEEKEREDDEYDYVAPVKRARSKKTNDWMPRSSTFKYTKKDAQGNVIYKVTRKNN